MFCAAVGSPQSPLAPALTEDLLSSWRKSLEVSLLSSGFPAHPASPALSVAEGAAEGGEGRPASRASPEGRAEQVTNRSCFQFLKNIFTNFEVPQRHEEDLH